MSTANQNLMIEFSAPITERATENKEFMIKGIAINETTTSNNHKFLAEELQSAAGTLKGVPLLADHKNEISSIKGRVTEAQFNTLNNSIPFSAIVIDKVAKEMISDGRLNSVSVGAEVSDIEEGENGELIPRGITFRELSLVAVPADSGATFSTALQEAYKSNQSHSNDLVAVNTQLKGGKDKAKMENKNTDVVENKELSAVTAILEEVKSILKETKDVQKANQELIDKAREEEKSNKPVKKVKEADEDEPKEEVKPEPKAEPEPKEEKEEEEEPEEEEAEEGANFSITESVGSLRGHAFTIKRK